MISPDRHVSYVGDFDAGFMRELGARAVFIQPRHGEPAIPRNFFCVVHCNQTVRVARVSNHKHAHIGCCVFLDGLALPDENFAVNAEQIFPFHTGFSRNAADQQRPVDVAKPFVEISGRHYRFEQWKSAIVQFHHHAIECAERIRDLDQMQRERLIRSEHLSGSDAEY